ncbi:MAG: antitoxin, partial [Lachnospiraceae bacterium]|nr:antitoxin [Lachnospiraceae bacterium]MCI9560584.1 antitoxin [Lachnospiraceae bacterium]
MKTISIRLEDTIYEELSEMLNAMGQTKQTFYESFTRTALRERRIPFIISAP